MSIKVLEQARKHPARDAAIHSITCAQNKDREGWLSMWHPDGVLEDPVGPSPQDPDGMGHRGIEKITAFYDNVISKSTVRFHIRETFACGSECANVGTITSKSEDGSIVREELVMLYRVDRDGKVLSLRAIFEIEDVIEDIF